MRVKVVKSKSSQYYFSLFFPLTHSLHVNPLPLLSSLCSGPRCAQVLRLLCLQSLVNGGLKQSTLDFFRREILQSYGFEYVLALDNLTKAGLLAPHAPVSE